MLFRLTICYLTVSVLNVVGLHVRVFSSEITRLRYLIHILIIQRSMFRRAIQNALFHSSLTTCKNLCVHYFDSNICPCKIFKKCKKILAKA